MNATQLKNHIEENYSSMCVLGLHDSMYAFLEGTIERILIGSERVTENDSQLDIVVAFDEPDSRVDFPILSIVDHVQRLVHNQDLYTNNHILLGVHKKCNEMCVSYPLAYRHVNEVHQKIKRWFELSSYGSDDALIDEIAELFREPNTLFTHPSLNGTSIDEVMMSEDELAFFTSETSDLAWTVQGQAVCTSCHTVISHVYEMQYEDINWHWDEEGKSYVKSMGPGDTEQKKCGHCGVQLDIDPLSNVFPY